MGKPYASDLQGLNNTYHWAISEDIRRFQSCIEETSCSPLLAVGSGGSFSAAHFAATLHENRFGELAKAVTPLEAIAQGSLNNVSVLLLSAGGKNPDIIAAFQHLVRREPRRIIVLCATKYSPLSELANGYDFADFVNFASPTGRDGFLATNTLLSFVLLLSRAYKEPTDQAHPLPPSLNALVHPKQSATAYAASLRSVCAGLWNRETLIVLHGSSTHAAALDLESKFSEAALGPVQLTDYRNFAHGRHNWLAKRGNSTGVICLISNEDQDIANRTLKLFPSDVAVARIVIPLSGEQAAIAAMVAALQIVGQAGEAKGIDPGRPKIPFFGRKMYHLKAWPKNRSGATLLSTVAIKRKAGLDPSRMRAEDLKSWQRFYEDFVHKIEESRFSSIVFDYDGTLCSKRDRYNGISKEISSHLERFLDAGITVGIATGRGKSVKQEMRQRINEKHWSSVVIGYYNGADIGLLGDDSHPSGSNTPVDDLALVADAIKLDSTLSLLADCTVRRMQITLEPKHPSYCGRVWLQVQEIAHRVGSPDIAVVRSSHSMDVLAPGVSKSKLVEDVRLKVTREIDSPVLCIGDLGRWPGNDFALLSEPYSLCVDEVSVSPATCWNLAPQAHKGPQACMDYLRAIKIQNHKLKLSVDRIGAKGRR